MTRREMGPRAVERARQRSEMPGAVIKVLLVDDHPVFVQALAHALERTADLTVVGSASGSEEACRKAAELDPDVALVDLTLGTEDGIEVTRRLGRLSPSTRVVILTGREDPSLFTRALEAGACGYLTKHVDLADVSEAVRRAHAGQVTLPRGVIGRILEAREPARGRAELSPRELEVLVLMAEGLDARTMSKALGISWHTVRSHIKNVLLKLDARSQIEAVAKALRLRILEPPTT